MPRYIAFLALASAAFAQQPGHLDPIPVLEAASRAMGVDKLRCISYSGTAYAGKVGQNVTQDTDWPKGEPLENYTRVINFDKRTSVETFDRTPGKNPASWKYGSGWLSGTPLQQHRRQTFAVAGDHAWRIDGQGEPVPANENAERWQLDIWLTPHGFVKAALEPGANPMAIWRWEMAESGRDGATTSGIEKITLVSATILGRYRVNATINSENQIQRLQTWVPDPVLGDMNFEHEFNDWREVDGVSFPAWRHDHDGWDDERQWPVISGGHNSFGGVWEDIRINDCGDAVTVPANVRAAAPQRAEATADEIAEGVWVVGGSSHNSVAVELEDFVVVIEAPLDEARSLAVIEKVVELVPDKPIRFIVNTHLHYDHLGGLRTYLHIGATVISHQRNRVFLETELLNYTPRTLEPDLVSLYPPTEISEGYTMEDVDEKYILSDGERSIEIYYVQGLNLHVEGMLMAYLPAEKMLIEADLFDPPAEGKPSELHQAFWNNVKQIGLEVDTIVPIHGRPVPWSSFERFMKR